MPDAGSGGGKRAPAADAPVPCCGLPSPLANAIRRTVARPVPAAVAPAKPKSPRG